MSDGPVTNKELVCISCPLGCRLSVTRQGETINVSGNRCSRGEIYGREEMLAPRRTVTATVRTSSESRRRLPVKTTAPLPKEWIAPLLNDLYGMEVSLPVRIGDTIIANIRGSGINLVATRTLESSAESQAV